MASSTSETSGPETSGPETSGPETSGPETSGPETSGPETSGPETSGPETSGPETSGPETSGPETSTRAPAPGAGGRHEPPLRWLWLTSLGLVALLAVASAFLGGPAAHHGEVRAELGAAPTRDEEALASLVRHGAPFALEERATVRVRLLGSGEALVSLVDVSLEPEPTLALAAGRDGPLPRDAVREAEASVEGDATVFFANVPPGDYVVRLSGEGHGELLAEVTSGGLSAPLLGVALALLLAPPLLLSIRRVTRGRSRV